MNLHLTEKKVLSTILEHQMISSGEYIIVAVSGGPDSVCLLNILFQLRERLNVSLIVAHLDHGLRPGEDEKETEFVTMLARKRNLAVAYEKASQLKKVHGASLEEKARVIRYQFFNSVLDQYHAHKVALGHNMDDQAETVLMHILRGTGIAGLSGIPPTREDRYIRPLIRIKREEIHAYLREKNLPFMMDSSNLDKRYLRNKMRLELIPILLRYQPRLIEHLDDLAFLCRHENRYMELEAERQLQAMIFDSSGLSLDICLANLKNLPVPLQYRIIRKAIAMTKGNLRRIDMRHIREIIELTSNSKPQVKINLPGDLTVKKVYERLRFSLGSEIQTSDFSYTIDSMGRFPLKEINKVISFEELTRKDFEGYAPSPWEGFFDLKAIHWPLIIRNFRAGDKFMPLGLNGFKKLKDVFIDNKIPSEERSAIPILENRGEIVWVCGIRVDNRYKVKEDTQRILGCKIE